MASKNSAIFLKWRFSQTLFLKRNECLSTTGSEPQFARGSHPSFRGEVLNTSFSGMNGNVIDRGVLERIRFSSCPCEDGRNRNEDSLQRERLKQLSDSRVAGWEDTLANKRKKKLEWKAERARKEEQRQQALDAEEAKLQQQARIDTLKHADSLLLEQTEKIRNFRSQQLLVETLNERDDQIKQKEEFRKKENDEEKLWRRVVMDDIKNSEQKRQVELARERQKSLELAKDLDMQRREREEQLRLKNQRKQEEEKAMIQQIASDNKAAEKAELQLKLQRKVRLVLHQINYLLYFIISSTLPL